MMWLLLAVGVAELLDGQHVGVVLQPEGEGDGVGRRDLVDRQHLGPGVLRLAVRSSNRLDSSTGCRTLGWTTWVPTARRRTRQAAVDQVLDGPPQRRPRHPELVGQGQLAVQAGSWASSPISMPACSSRWATW